MTRDEVLDRLSSRRAVFDAKVAAVPADCCESAPPGSAHSVRDIVVHVTAYEQLIVDRLRAAREGKTTAFDRDRVSWEFFNETTWGHASHVAARSAMEGSRQVFSELMEEVSALSDEELNDTVGVTACVDPAWLEGKKLWELIAIDTFDHYPMRYAALQGAAG